MDWRPRLLLVEDEHSLRSLVAQFLTDAGCLVVEAADGPQAVELFETDGPFDLILLDLNLPGISGIEVCRRVREQAPGQPVLIVSGAILPEHDLALESMGVVEQLSKPYHPDTLRLRIERLLAPSRPRRSLAFTRAVE